MAKMKSKKMSKAVLVAIILAAAAVVMVIMMICIPLLGIDKSYTSKNIGYTLKYNTKELEYENILLDRQNLIYMDRYVIPGSNGQFYLAVNRVAPDTNLDEALDAFESDGSYRFTREDNITYGAEQYPARKISYVEYKGTTEVYVSYYYDEANAILVTICTDEQHREFLEKTLADIRVAEK